MCDAAAICCDQVHKFSKFIHGTATLLPELVQAVPYWVDDESVRPSMLNSAPQLPQSMYVLSYFSLY